MNGEYGISPGCSESKTVDYSLIKMLNGSWNVMGKSESISFEYGCENQMMTFEYSNDYSFNVQMSCYNYLLQKNISSIGQLYYDGIKSQFGLTYITDGLSWNRHFGHPINIVYASSRHIVMTSCFKDFDPHLQNMRFEYNCKNSYYYHGCSWRGIWWEFCNDMCPNRKKSHHPANEYYATNVWILSKEKGLSSFKNLKEILVQEKYGVTDLKSVHQD